MRTRLGRCLLSAIVVAASLTTLGVGPGVDPAGAQVSATPTPPIIPVPSTLLPVRSVVNGGFEDPVIVPTQNDFAFPEALNGTLDAGEQQLLGWQTTHPAGLGRDRPVEAWRAAGVVDDLSGGTVAASEGQQFIELNAEVAAAVYQDLCVQVGETVNFSWQHQARGDALAVNRMSASISDPAEWSGVTPDPTPDFVDATYTATGATEWVQQSGSWVSTVTGARRFAFAAEQGTGGSTGVGNLLDDVQLDLPPTIEFLDPDPANGVNVPRPALDGRFYVTFAANGTTVGGETIEGAAVGATFGVEFNFTGLFDGNGNPRTDVAVTPAGNGNFLLTFPANEWDPNDPADYITAQFTPTAALTTKGAVSAALVNPQGGIALGDAQCVGAPTGSLPLSFGPTGDLSVTKASAGDFTEGGTVTYTVTVGLTGGSNGSSAIQAEISDPAPAELFGVTWTCAPSAGSTCAPSGSGDITDTPTIADNGSVVYTVTGRIRPGTTSVTNTASLVEGNNFFDVRTDNNTASVTDPVSPGAVLAQAKNMTVVGNGPWTLTIDYVSENLGSQGANGLSMPDDLAAVFGTVGTDWSFTSVAKTSGPATFDVNAGFDGAGTTELINAGSSLAPGESGSIQVVITLNTPGTYTNQTVITGTSSVSGAAVSADSASGANPDADGDGAPDPSGVTPTDPPTIAPPAYDLSITKDDGVTSAVQGGTVTYTIVAANNGPDAIDVVNVADTFPAEVTCSTTSTAAGGATGNTAGPFATAIADTLAMPSGSSVTYTAVCSVSATAVGPLVNTATIDTPVTTPETDETNNGATDTDTLGAEADLSITKTDDLDPVVAGQQVTYTITVTNAGPSPATNVRTTDTLPPSVSAVGSAGCVQDPNGSVACTLGNLAAGASASYTVTVQTPVGDGTDLSNAVTVTSDTADSDTSNNSVVEPTEVLLPSVAIVKTAVPDGSACPGTDGATLEVVSGSQVLYCFDVTNTGEVPLTGVTIADPDTGANIAVADLAVGAGSAEQFGPVAAANTVNNATVSGTPSDGAGTALTDRAAAPAQLAPVTATDNAIVEVSTPGLELRKTVTAGTACPGSEFLFASNGYVATYCFEVENTGSSPLDLAGMTFTDTLPGVTIADLTPAPAGVLAPGATAVFSLTAPVTADLVNSATVTLSPLDAGGNPLPGATPLTATDTAEVQVADPSFTGVKTVYLGHDGGASCPGVATLEALAGDDITYCIDATNASSTAGVIGTIDDPTLDADFPAGANGRTNAFSLVGGGAAPAFLAAGQTISVFFETTATADVVNEATGSGVVTDVGGVPLPDTPPLVVTVGAEVNVVAPAIDLQTTVVAGAGADCTAGVELVTVLPGTDVTYCYVVSNTGDVALTDISLDLTGLTAGTLPVPGTIPAGGSATVSTVVTAVANDITAAQTSGSATATAQPSSDLGAPFQGIPVVSDADGAAVDVVQPAVEVAKTVYAGHDGGASCPGGDEVNVNQGDDVTFCFTITNTGDTFLTDAMVSDPALGLTLTAPAPLAPGESVTLFAEAQSSTTLPNSASVTATPADATGVPLPDLPAVSSDTPDAATVTVDPGELTLEKRAYAGHDGGAGCATATTSVTVNEGDAITYCFVVTNIGGQPVTGVVVEDAQLGLTGASALSVGDLAPDQSVTVFAEATADPAMSTNSASVRGTGGDGAAVQGVGSVTITVTAIPETGAESVPLGLAGGVLLTLGVMLLFVAGPWRRSLLATVRRQTELLRFFGF